MDKRKDLPSTIKLDNDPAEPQDQWSPEEIAFYFDKALAVLNADNFTTAKEYIDLLVNQCLAEKHWSDAFTAFLTRIKEMGLEIAMEEADQTKLTQLNERLFYWRTCRMMIHAAGLLRYEEEILKYEIAKFYQPTPTFLPPPRTKEVPIERPRRSKSEKPKHKSVLRPEPKPKAPAGEQRQNKPKPKPIKQPIKINPPKF